MLMAVVFSALVSVKRMKQNRRNPEQTGTNVCNNKGYDIEFKNVVFSTMRSRFWKGRILCGKARGGYGAG